MVKIKARFGNDEVFGTMKDEGLKYHPIIEDMAYVTVFDFGEITIESIFPRSEAEKNFNSSQIRICHDKNILDSHGFTDVEIIDG